MLQIGHTPYSMTKIIFTLQNGRSLSPVILHGPNEPATSEGDAWNVVDRLGTLPFVDPERFYYLMMGLPKQVTLPRLGPVMVQRL